MSTARATVRRALEVRLEDEAGVNLQNIQKLRKGVGTVT